MRTVQILTAAFAASIIPLVSSASDPVNPMFETKAARPPGLVQPGALVKGCSGWIKATPGMTCEELAGLLNIDMKQLLLQNPQIANGDCVHNFWADYYYCTGLIPSEPKITDPPRRPPPPPPPPPKKTIDADCKQAHDDQCASAVFAASETPVPMRDWCGRYLGGPKCTEVHPEGIFSSYDKFPKQAMASSLCAYPNAPPMYPRFSTACRCFTEMYPKPTR